MNTDLFPLMKPAQEGDLDKKNKIFSFLLARFLVLAKLYVGDDDAEDIVQETLMLVNSHFSAITTPEALLAFTNRVMRNKMGNFYRRRDLRKTWQLSVEEIQEPAFYSVEDWGPGRLQQILFEAIGLLGKSKPVCGGLLMGLVAGESSEELCQSLGIPSHRLDDRIYKCRNALRRILRERWGLRL